MPKFGRVGGNGLQPQRRAQNRFPRLQRWKARLVSRLRGASQTLSPAEIHERRFIAEKVRKTIRERGAQHCTNVDMARQTLHRQRLRDTGKAGADSPIVMAKQDDQMRHIHPIAKGGYGITDAVAPDGRGPISVRKLNRRHKNSEQHVRALRKEEQLLQRLDHPNIVKTAPGHQVTTDAPVMYMEHGGGSLSKYIKGLKKPLPSYLAGKSPSKRKTAEVRDARRRAKLGFDLSRQLLSGVAYLNTQNIVHRDLKPDNLLINPADGKLKIADFGLAAEIGTPEMGNVSGTPSYLAPEVIGLYLGWNQDGYDTKADVFSAGCVLYELFTGEKYLNLPKMTIYEPYAKAYSELEDRNLYEWLLKRINPQKMPHLSEEESKRIVTMLTGMLEFNPAQRFSPELARMALDGELVALPPVSSKGWGYKVLRWFKSLY